LIHSLLAKYALRLILALYHGVFLYIMASMA
jgi:hypothetical protein